MDTPESNPIIPVTRLSVPALIVASLMGAVFAAGGAWALTSHAEANHETRLTRLEEVRLPDAREMQSVQDRLSAVEKMQERQNIQLDRIEIQTRK